MQIILAPFKCPAQAKIQEQSFPIPFNIGFLPPGCLTIKSLNSYTPPNSTISIFFQSFIYFLTNYQVYYFSFQTILCDSIICPNKCLEISYIYFVRCNIKNSQPKTYFLMFLKTENKKKDPSQIQLIRVVQSNHKSISLGIETEQTFKKIIQQSQNFQSGSVGQKEKLGVGKQRKTRTTKLADIAKKFIQIISIERNQRITIIKAAKKVGVPKRRIYDIVNVLQGVGLVQHSKGNSIQWIGHVCSQTEYVTQVEDQMKGIDEMIKEKEEEIEQIMHGQSKEYLFLLKKDFVQMQKAKDLFQIQLLNSYRNYQGKKQAQQNIQREGKQNISENQTRRRIIYCSFNKLKEGANDFLVASLPLNSQLQYSIQTSPNSRDQKIRKILAIFWTKQKQENQKTQQKIASIFAFKSQFSHICYKLRLTESKTAEMMKLQGQRDFIINLEQNN